MNAISVKIVLRSLISLMTLLLDGGFITTDLYSKPTDNQIYLDALISHSFHWMKAKPHGIDTRIRRNCSTEMSDKRSSEYQRSFTRRGYMKRIVKRESEIY